MSRFLPLSRYQEPLSHGYSLTPLRFTRLHGTRYVATNQAGEFLVLERDDLDRLVKHQLDPRSTLYNDLKSKHFLIDRDSSVGLDLLALKVRTKLHRLANFTSLHMIVVTLRCDNSCAYCQVSRKNDDQRAFDMSSDTAKQTVDMVFQSPSPAIKIEFQGGETLLNFALIREIVELAEATNVREKRDLTFVIATNLASLSDEILEFCFRHRILISTSLDGPEDLHNKNRPRPGGNSYALTVQGIKRAQEYLGRDRVSALMTTTEASLSRVRDIVDEYLALGMPGIFLRPLSPYGFAVKTRAYNAYDTDRWLEFYKEGLSYIIEVNRSGYFFPENYASMILTKMLSPFETGYVDQMSPAGIGIAGVIYNYDGYVYASDESRMRAEMGDTTFRLGSVHTDSHEEIFTSDALLDPLELSFADSVPMCSECAFEPFCGAEPVYHHATQGDFVGRKPLSGFCRRNMEICRQLISELEADDDTRRVLASWVTA